MNIGIDIRCLMNPVRTGVAEYTYELLSALFKVDHENQYFLYYNSYKDVSDYVKMWNQDNVHYVYTRWPNKLFNASQVLFGLPKLDEFRGTRDEGRGTGKIDIFFSPNLNFTSISSKIKHVLTVHDLSFEIMPECYSVKRRLWHKIINPKKQCERAELILVPSENTKRDVIEMYGVGREKVRVLKPGLCSNVGDEGRGTRDDGVARKYNLSEKFILFLGTVEPRKNIEAIIDAFEKSSLQATGYTLQVAGSKGWKYESIIKKINSTKGVHYIGYVDEQDKQALYELADLFVYPSLYEGFGFPVLEAMATGTPVITSSRSSLTEVVGDVAYLVNPYNVSDIARGMELILKDNNLRGMMIKEGKEKAREFEWNKTAQEFLNLSF